MRIMEKEKNIQRFLVCTDDVEYCKDTILQKNKTYLYHESAIYDLIMMSKCSHGILSASSLSWWAAYISRKNNKVLDQFFIAPLHWTGHRKKSWFYYEFYFEWINYL